MVIVIHRFNYFCYEDRVARWLEAIFFKCSVPVPVVFVLVKKKRLNKRIKSRETIKDKFTIIIIKYFSIVHPLVEFLSR